MKSWIGVDLDGTLARYDGWQGIDHVGEAIEPMCDRVREWLADEVQVKIFTARVYTNGLRDLVEVKAPIEEFCLREFGQILEITNVKDFGMAELWDDRAIQIIPNTGLRADKTG